jgi:hypothetical protein
MRECAGGVVNYNAGVVDDFLELGSGFAALPCC